MPKEKSNLENSKTPAMAFAGNLRKFLLCLYLIVLVLITALITLGQARIRISGAQFLDLAIAASFFLTVIVGLYTIHALLGAFSKGEFFSLNCAARIGILAWTSLGLFAIDLLQSNMFGSYSLNIPAAIAPIILFPVSRVWYDEAERQTS